MEMHNILPCRDVQCQTAKRDGAVKAHTNRQPVPAGLQGEIVHACFCVPCHYCAHCTYGIRLRSTHCKEYLVVCRPAYFFRTTQYLPHPVHVSSGRFRMLCNMHNTYMCCYCITLFFWRLVNFKNYCSLIILDSSIFFMSSNRINEQVITYSNHDKCSKLYEI